MWTEGRQHLGRLIEGVNLVFSPLRNPPMAYQMRVHLGETPTTVSSSGPETQWGKELDLGARHKDHLGGVS